MADYTIISNSDEQNTATVVVEYAVPVGSNSATPTPIAWQAIVADLRTFNGETGTTVNPTKQSDGPHIAALDAGSLLELQLTVEYDANLSNPAKVTEIENAITARLADYTTEFSNIYEFYGTEGTA